MLHLLIDLGRPHVQGTPEYARERQHVIDLVGEIAAAGAHHRRPGLPGQVGHNFRRGVCHGEEHRFLRHGTHHVLRNDSRRGYADEHVRPLHRLRQPALGNLGTGQLRQLHANRVLLQAGPAGVDNPLAVTHRRAAQPHGPQQL